MKTKLKTLKIAAIISGVISCILIFFNFGMPLIIKQVLLTKFNKSDATSVGIIGGSDGPTAIFVSTNTVKCISGYISTGISAAVTIILIVIYRRLKKKDL